MEIIYLTQSPKKQLNIQESIVLALGFFDGVHKGHQAVIRTAQSIAKEKKLASAVLSFHQSPAVVLKGEQHPTYLTPLSKKIRLLEEMGVEYFFVVPFDRAFSKLSPQQFVDDYIVGLRTDTVVAGFDYTYGKPDQASMKHLPLYAANRFHIMEVPQHLLHNEKISSTAIRHALSHQDVEGVTDMLGRFYEVEGTVVQGFGRGGNLLGYPTANVDYGTYTLFDQGVFVVDVHLNGLRYKGMASIGWNPTFDDVQQKMLEVYIVDFNEDIYGKEIRVAFRKWLRDEKKFNSVDELIQQLHQDKMDTLAFYEQER